MKIKLTPKQNSFCRTYIETGNASEAYRQSYNAGNMKPDTIKKRASELLAKRDISGTIEIMQQSMRDKHNVTVDSITAELAEDRALAYRVGQSGSAVAATMGKAKLHGIIVDKQHIDHTSSDGAFGDRLDRAWRKMKNKQLSNAPP